MTKLTVPMPDGPLVVHRLGGTAGAPVALLVHGTGFCGSVWLGVAETLSATFEVYAVDRRGHGESHKPATAYDFADFAGDLVEVIDTLHLAGAYGIGHSAGATDLLLAAARRPDAFRRLVALEPTVVHPEEPVRRPELAPLHEEAQRQLLRRLDTFAGGDEVAERLRGRGIFTGWREDLLQAYVRDGFERGDDGLLRRRCRPSMEAAMLGPIFAAMEGRHGDVGSPSLFAGLRSLDVPTLVVTTEQSQPIYKQMAEIAAELLPVATRHHIDGVGHAVPQTAPDVLGALVVGYWQTAAAPPTR